MASIPHDTMYTEWGNEEDREHADHCLLKWMIELCDTMYQRKWAGIYYLLVRKYGRIFFNFHFANKIK